LATVVADVVQATVREGQDAAAMDWVRVTAFGVPCPQSGRRWPSSVRAPDSLRRR
jgi:hypothetical protein